MPPAARIYLDNAATSWPKPDEVYAAVDRYQRQIGAPAGRGGYAEAIEVGRVLQQARSGLAQLIGASDARSIVFANSGTDAINTALYGLLKAGDHVVTTELEHNSVLRPLRHLQATRGITVTRVGCNAAGQIDPDDVRKALRSPNLTGPQSTGRASGTQADQVQLGLLSQSTRLVAITHASNVTGVVQPIAEIARIAHQHAALLLVDAAQTVGHLPLNVQRIGCDLLAAPGHKGLLGPLGTGFLYLSPGVEQHVDSFRQGGTGTRSEEDTQPGTLPDKYEAGNQNVPGLFGLAAGIAYLQQRSVADVHAYEISLAKQLGAGLRAIDGVSVYPQSTADDRVAVVSFNVAGYDPQELATLLDSTFRIQVRAGFHCAMPVHRAIQTIELGGTVRVSIGAFNTAAEIAATLDAIAEIAESDATI